MMTFFTAIERVASGAEATREEWADPRIVMLMRDGFLSIKKADGSTHRLMLSDGNLAGTDWRITAEAAR